MIGLDTNVLIRYLVQDDKKQFHQAENLIEFAIKRKDSLYICMVVLCEVVWVLNYHYEFSKEEIKPFLEQLLHSEQIELENREIALKAFQEYQTAQADFPDCLIGMTNQTRGCSTTYTFDKKAQKLTSFTRV